MISNTTTDDAQSDTIAVEHNGETIDVPLGFERSDLAAWFGDVPDSFGVDRVFALENNVRVESHLGGGEWVEAVYQTEQSAPVFNASELGWVAERITGSEDAAYPDAQDADRYPGETLWINDEG